MKNWLIALLGVSLVAISYTAYELELKKPALAPSLEQVVATGQPATSAPKQKSAPPAEKQAKAAPPVRSEPVEKTSPETKISESAQTSATETTPPEPESGAKSVEAEAGGETVATTPQAGEAEAPTVAEKIMDTVVSLLPESADTDSKDVSTPGETDSSLMAPVAKAVDTVRKLLSNDEDTETTVTEATPTEPVVQEQVRAPGENSGDVTPKGLVERAVEAVTEFVTPKKPADNPNAEKSAVAGGAGSKPAKPPVATREETTVAARSPEPAAVPAEPAKPAGGPVVPSFDVVRVERDGSAIIAGRAEPGAEIELRAGGKTLGTAKASGRGEFVIIPDAPIPAGSSALALEAKSDDGRVTKSNQVVTVAVPEPAAPASTKVAAAPAPEPKSEIAKAAVKKVPVKTPVKIPPEIEIAAAPVVTPPAASSPERKVAAAPKPVQVPETAAPMVKSEVKPEEPALSDNSPAASEVIPPVAEAPSVDAESPVQPVAKRPDNAEIKIANIPVTATDAPKAAAPTPPAVAAPAPAAPAPETPAPPAPTVAAPTQIVPAPLNKPEESKIAKSSKSDGVETTQNAVIVPLPQSVSPAPETKSAAAAPEATRKKTTVVAAPSRPEKPDVKPVPQAGLAAAETTAPESAEPAASEVATAAMPKTAADSASKAAVPAPETAKALAPVAVEAPAPEVAESPAPAPVAEQKPAPEPAEVTIAAAPKVTSEEAADPAAAVPEPSVSTTEPKIKTAPATETKKATDTVAVARDQTPVAAPQASPAPAKPATEKDPASVVAVAPDAEASPSPSRLKLQIAEAKPAEVPAPAKVTEPLVVVSEPGKPSLVLQGGNDEPKAPITFDTVDYDDEGQIILAGRVAPGADVRAYLGAAHLGDAKADGAGRWVLRTTRQIDPGNYQLRVDKIDVGGKVLARVSAPFERAAPEAVARVRANGEVIIQPGDNLWNISRALYGTGTQYTVIYDANRNQISKPELIFPGQVFMTPGAPVTPAAEATSG